jgi:hypothetical protein
LRWKALLWVTVAVVHLWTLLRYPNPFVAEAWYASRAWALINHGQAFGPLDSGVFDRYPGYWTYFQWVPVFLQSLGLRWFEHPTLLPLRLLSLFFGGVLLAAIWAIAVDLCNRTTAYLSVLLVAT